MPEGRDLATEAEMKYQRALGINGDDICVHGVIRSKGIGNNDGDFGGKEFKSNATKRAAPRTESAVLR